MNNELEDKIEVIKDTINEVSPRLAEQFDAVGKKNLTDEELSSLVESEDGLLSEQDKKDIELLNNIPDEELEGEIGTETVSVNPYTGETIVDQDKLKTAEVPISEIKDLSEEDLNKDNITEGISGIFNKDISDEDSQKIVEIILKLQKGEKFSVYNELPQVLKDDIKKMVGSNNQVMLQSAAKDIIKMFSNELKINREFIDFQESLKKELEIPNLVDMYADHLQDLMENKLKEKADKLAETAPEKAKVLYDVVQAFKDSYTMNKELELLENSSTALKKQIAKKVRKFNRLLDEINYKYKDIKLVINNINDAVLTLCKVIDNKYDAEDVKNFVGLYYFLTRNMQPENVAEHTFMYYTIKNIISLQYGDIDSEFNKNLLNNIYKVLDKLKEA